MRKEITLHLSFGFCKSFSVRHSQVFSKSIDHLKTENSSGGVLYPRSNPLPFRLPFEWKRFPFGISFIEKGTLVTYPPKKVASLF